MRVYSPTNQSISLENVGDFQVYTLLVLGVPMHLRYSSEELTIILKFVFYQ